MKKVFSLLAVLALVCMAGTVFAESFTSAAKTAIATFRAGEIGFNVALKTWNSNYTGSTTDTITWDTSTIPLGSNDAYGAWANVYAELTSDITTTNGKVYVYQDNRTNPSPYTATTAENGKFAGLVKSDTGGGTNGYASLGYMCRTLEGTKGAKTVYTSLPTGGVVDSNGHAGDWTNATYNGQRYFVDKGDSDWATQKTGDYIVLADNNGTWYENGSDEHGPWVNKTKDPVVMFFYAAFPKGILGEDSFGTEKIIFSAQVE